MSLAASGAVISGLQVVEVAGTASTTVVELGEQDVSELRSAPSSAAAIVVEASGTAAVRRSFRALETISAGG
jgi:hypothetical protein